MTWLGWILLCVFVPMCFATLFGAALIALAVWCERIDDVERERWS